MAGLRNFGLGVLLLVAYVWIAYLAVAAGETIASLGMTFASMAAGVASVVGLRALNKKYENGG